jgi:tetratricopeptide (TPR) repeat protein
MTEEWQRQYFFEALARALLRAGTSHNPYGQPLLLLLDDLQWCDNDTLEWLHYLLHFEPGARLLLIGTVRSEEILPGHPLVEFLGILQRDGLVTEVALRPLNTMETASLAEHIMGHWLDPATINTLYSETEGNPLFVVEMVRAGTLEQGGRAQPVAGNALPLLTQPASMLPPTVQIVLSTRLAQLSPLAREVANVAAVIGREFTFVVLARANRESEDTVVRGLDELWQRRIVREQDAGAAETYDFSHDKLREQAYASLSPAHRHLLHRHVAEALEEVYAKDLDAVSGQIAAHFERAGLPEQAIPYFLRASEVAMRIYANAEAITAFQRAATLLEAGSPGNARQATQWEIAAHIYESLGDIFEVTGQLQEARQAFQHAMTSLLPQEYIGQARLHRKMAKIWQFVSDNPQDTFHVNARQAFQEAERILEQAPVKSNTGWLQECIQLQLDQLLPHRASVDEMTAVIEKAQPIVEKYGTAEQRSQFSLAVVVRDVARDRYVVSEQTVSSCRTALATIQQTANKWWVGFAHFSLGVCLLWSDHLDEAEEKLRVALGVGEQIGSATLLARCLTFLPFIFRRRGQVEQVRSIITRALAASQGRKNSTLTGHRAWLAWRDGNMVEAEAYGRASAEEGQPEQSANLFLWVGLWPLIGVALAQEKIAGAINYVHMLLDPALQPLPEQLSTLLASVLQAWDAGQHAEAHALLQQAVPLAEQMGYL